MSGPNLPTTARERLIVALDLPSGDEAISLVRRLGGEVEWVKVGLELFSACGPSIVRDLAALDKKIFLDLKFHDIPTTVARAVASVARLPVGLVDIHARAGSQTMVAAREAAGARDDLGVIGVTRLTSDAGTGLGFADVERLADEAAAAGLFGVVCPAAAAAALRNRHADRLARVVPGIRPAGSESHDQVHVATPAGAVAGGAHWIVVGRPITRAPDPAEAAREIVAALARSPEV